MKTKIEKLTEREKKVRAYLTARDLRGMKPELAEKLIAMGYRRL